jgi:dTMP kinase
VRRGFFITFEGGEGAGKSTQARRLAETLRSRGRDVVLTREPGGSSGAEALRALLVTGGADRWSPLCEALMMNAARADHLERLIRPALARGAVVICDRFADSTRAYQGAGGGLSPQALATLERLVVGEDRPDLTLVFDLPVEVGLERARQRADGETRFETKGDDFHQRLRAAYRAIAEAEPDRCVLIDAARPVEAVWEAVAAAVDARLVGPAPEPAHG